MAKNGMSRLLLCGEFKGDLKALFGWLFLRQLYLQVSDEDQKTEEPEEIEEEEEDDDVVDEADYD